MPILCQNRQSLDGRGLPCYRPAPLQGKKQKSGDPFLIAFGIYGGVGMQLALSVVGGLLLGHYLDGRWGTHPWLALIGLTLGTIGGFYNLIRILIWNQERKERRQRQFQNASRSQRSQPGDRTK